MFLHWTQRAPHGPWGNSDLSCPQHRIKCNMQGTTGEDGVLNKLSLSVLKGMFDSLIFPYLLELYLAQITKLSRIRKYVSRILIPFNRGYFNIIHVYPLCPDMQCTSVTDPFMWAIQARTIPKQQNQTWRKTSISQGLRKCEKEKIFHTKIQTKQLRGGHSLHSFKSWLK